MIFVVSFLVKALAAELANVRPVAQVDPHVGVEGGATIEGLAAGLTLVRLLRGVNDFVATKSGCL